MRGHIDETGEGLHGLCLERHHLGALVMGIGQKLDLGPEIGLFLKVPGDRDTSESLDEDADAPVGVLEHLEDAPDVVVDERDAGHSESFAPGPLRQ